MRASQFPDSHRVYEMNYRRIRGAAAAIFFLFVIALVSLSRGIAGTDPRTGKDLFGRRCSGCHATDSNRVGPPLRGVLGRKAGTVAGFPYSEALRSSGIIWTADLLNEWLQDPEALVMDNDMEFRVPNPDERAALIAYLRTLTN
jgi:cytochrome c